MAVMNEHKINPKQKIQTGHYSAIDENNSDDNGDDDEEKLLRYCCSTKRNPSRTLVTGRMHKEQTTLKTSQYIYE